MCALRHRTTPPPTVAAHPRRNVLGAMVVGLSAIGAGCAEATTPEPQWMMQLDAVPCSTQLRATLQEWGARDGVVAAPAPIANAHLRFPTSQIGTWVVLDVASPRPTVRRVTPERVTTKAFAANCVAAATTEPTTVHPRSDAHFTDADLANATVTFSTTGSRGVVVYLWSPHMGLSVDGYSEIAAAALAHQLGLVTVLFPGSAAGFAAEEALRAGIPPDGLREAASIELAFRDALVHAPSILVFADDRVSEVLPGFRDAEGYTRFLREFLSAS